MVGLPGTASTAGSLPALMPLHPSTDPEAAAAGEQGAFRLGATVVCLCVCPFLRSCPSCVALSIGLSNLFGAGIFRNNFHSITHLVRLCALCEHTADAAVPWLSLSLSANARLSVYVSLQLAPTFPTFRSLYLFSFFLSFFYTRYCRTN